MKRDYHMSDCATNNAPALPVGECNCGLEKHLTEEPFKKFTLMNESLNTFATDNSNGKHLTERAMKAEEIHEEACRIANMVYIDSTGATEIIRGKERIVEAVKEAIRLSKIEALEEMINKISTGKDYYGNHVDGINYSIDILTSQINQLKNGK